jgi:hypothetical protein
MNLLLNKILLIVLLFVSSAALYAQGSGRTIIKPTYARIAYGDDSKQYIDFYKADSDKPTPIIVYIHGGGWKGGSAEGILQTNVFGTFNQKGEGVMDVLKKGISVASVEYRFLSKATKAGVNPPVQWPMLDAARALQFIRSKAKEWNIDKTSVGLTGSSAGGCTALWLAMHPDLADSASFDPIARESTRVNCVGVLNAQTTLDPKELSQLFKSPQYGGHAFGFVKSVEGKEVSDMDVFLMSREHLIPFIMEYSPIAWASDDDPPMCLVYDAAPQKTGEPQTDSVHGAAYGVHLKNTLDSLGVECYLIYPDHNESSFIDHIDFLVSKLKNKSI